MITRNELLHKLFLAEEAIKEIKKIESGLESYRGFIAEDLSLAEASRIGKAMRTIANALDEVLELNSVPGEAGSFSDIANEAEAELESAGEAEDERRKEMDEIGPRRGEGEE